MIKKGRPREFDTEQAVETALQVFWEKGYEGATMADLSSAMALKPGSIYAAFGSKAGLFERVLDRYADTVFNYGNEALEGTTAREIAERWINGAVEATTRRGRPSGCLLVQGALATGDGASDARASVCDRRRGGLAVLAARFSELGDVADPDAAAEYVIALAEGIAVQASSGASRKRLRAVADLALRHLPWE